MYFAAITAYFETPIAAHTSSTSITSTGPSWSRSLLVQVLDGLCLGALPLSFESSTYSVDSYCSTVQYFCEDHLALTGGHCLDLCRLAFATNYFEIALRHFDRRKRTSSCPCILAATCIVPHCIVEYSEELQCTYSNYLVQQCTSIVFAL